jgi:hypothetical protein
MGVSLRQSSMGMEEAYLLAGISASSDDGDTANLEELHVGGSLCVCRVDGGGVAGV